MPVHAGRDNVGAFYQWGSSGKKYHYKTSDPAGRARAKKRAEAQGKAAYANGYEGKRSV